MKESNQEWFQKWFDSPYYSILYKHRDLSEAESFLDALISFLKPLPRSTALDVACGQGRHSIYLNQKNFDVTGIDISQKNIEHNLKFKNDTLSFFVHDMRQPFKKNHFDHVLNLFTSFGYFENEDHNIQTIKAMSTALKSGGKFILDFMNTEKALTELKNQETKIIDKIEFKIERSVDNNFIVKEISVSDQGEKYTYKEKVKALTLSDFEKYFAMADLKIVNLFGDYKLNSFDAKNSDRLILIAEKNS